MPFTENLEFANCLRVGSWLAFYFSLHVSDGPIHSTGVEYSGFDWLLLDIVWSVKFTLSHPSLL